MTAYDRFLRDANAKEKVDIDVLMTFYSAQMTGSRYYSEKLQPRGADFDLFSFGKYQKSDLIEGWLRGNGYELGGSMHDDPARQFSSYKNGRVNVIVTHRYQFHTDFNRATEVCHALGDSLTKAQRIIIFRMFLYNEFPEVAI